MRGTRLARLTAFAAVTGPRVFPQAASHLGVAALRRLSIAAMAAILLSGSAFAQTMSGSSPVMAPTSPLGVTGSQSVAPTGIPMGATALGTAGVSPLPSGTSVYGSSTGSTIPCSAAPSSTMGGSTAGESGVPSATGTFDGGGIAGMPSAPPPGGISGTGVSPATTAMAVSGSGTSPCGGATTAGGSGTYSSSPSTISPGGASRAGVPMGSTEIGNAGISGVPAITTPTPTVSNILPGSTNCPTNGMTNPLNPGAIPTTSGYPGVC